MTQESIYSEEEILKLIEKMERGNFILANIARMAYFGGLRENEIQKIKIENVLNNGCLVKEIQPFLPETRAYTARAISLDEEAKPFLEEHIKKLQENRYDLSDNAPLFPHKRTCQPYKTRTLIYQFKKYFGEITFTKLRELGDQRKDEKLRNKYSDPYLVKKEMEKHARHSRPNTTNKRLNGKVDKPGRARKRDQPWELIVRSIEGLVRIRGAAARTEKSEGLEKEISSLEYRREVKDSLRRLLEEYNARPPIPMADSKSNQSTKSLSEMISKGISDKELVKREN